MGACTGGGTAPGSGTNVDRDGNDAWSDPGNITASNNTYASITLSGGGETSDWLVASGYNLNVPASVTILGIQVEIERHASDEPCAFYNIIDSSIRLHNGTSLKGDDKKKDGWWSANETCATYGGSTDLWGATWTPSELNNMSVYCSVENSGTLALNTTAYVDTITLRVWCGYPAFPQLIGSKAEPKSGIRIDRGSCGDVRSQILYSADRKIFTVKHRLKSADKDTLDSFYNDFKALEFTFTWAADNQNYDCIFMDAPQYIPIGAGWFDVTAFLAQTTITKYYEDETGDYYEDETGDYYEKF